MVWIPGGTFQMGSNEHYPEEAPVRSVTVGGFWMDAHVVTNTEFRRFVKATGYVTVAERTPNAEDYPGALPDMLKAGSIVFVAPDHRVDLNHHYNWWTYVFGADWRHPEGPGSTLDGRERHPVVHVAAEDVEAYLAWAGKTLPNEAEWEFAARGGLEGAEYVWGDEFAPRGRQMANTWQGEFPIQNLLLDGFDRTSPVGSFPCNGFGLFDMAGNVWEWTADWYRPVLEADIDVCCAASTSYDPATPEIKIPRRVLKGGSFMCAPNYCRRYRPAARIPHPVDSGTCHLGFRGIVRPELP